MLAIMRAFALPLRLILSVLVSLTISVSPVFALSGVQAAKPDTSIRHDEGTPCNMPCDDCGDEKQSPRCAFACAGLIAGVVAQAVASPTVPDAVRIGAPMCIAFVDRDDEPDKPPPKSNLA